jgi:hypothetical protein
LKLPAKSSSQSFRSASGQTSPDLPDGAIAKGTLMREARQLCPAVVPLQANHRLYTEYHERILKAVDTCLPVEKVCSIDEMA